MKKIIMKLVWVIVCVFIFAAVFVTSCFVKARDIFGGELFTNFAMAGSMSVEKLGEDDYTKEIVDIQYIKEDETVDTREMIICRPSNKKSDVPVVYIPHYALDENTSDFVSYIKRGWAVASPYNFKPKYNGTLVTDDLVFNNAALYTLRHTKGIDAQKIVLVGGSAGGYMTLMLSELQMGNAAALATSPITNTYFNGYKYFPECDEMNRSSGMFDFIMPIQGMVSKSFQTLNNVIGDNIEKWEAVSPISMAKAVSSPLVMTHNTSDILVPIDQVTHLYTYEENDGTLPKGFNCHLPDRYPGILSKTFEEMANQDELVIHYLKLENFNVTGDLPYSDKLITIDVIDDGAPTAKGSHSNPKLKGGFNNLVYLDEVINSGLKNTEVLVKDKILLMLERYNGQSVALPPHINVDDSIYGSLAIYQKEIIEEFEMYMKNHSFNELDDFVRNAINNPEKSNEQNLYRKIWEEIRGKLL